MTLLCSQREMQAHILSEDAIAPADWDERMLAGMAIYRNGYRSRLVDALQESFPRTFEWVGPESFARAAAHHVISSPPSCWTLDEVGLGFSELLKTLFASDPEVCELAWLEWAMHRAYTAPSNIPLDTARFSASTDDFEEEDWNHLRITFLPGTQLRAIRTCCDTIWRTLSHGGERPGDIMLPEPGEIIVWREGLYPVFQRIDTLEAECLRLMQRGENFGAMCEFLVARHGEKGIAAAGNMLATWIARGITLTCDARSP